MEKRTAPHAWLSNFIVLILISVCSLTVYAQTPEPLLEKMFGTKTPESQCKTLSRHPSGDLQSFDEPLNKAIQTYLTAWRKEDDKGIFDSLHASNQDAFSQKKVYALLSHMKKAYGIPLEFSILRIWGVYTKKESDVSIECTDEGLNVLPMYGYPLQIYVWMQVRGEKELGRLLTTFVMTKGLWKVGSLHLQQWTFGGKDPGTWMENADLDLKNKNNISAYVKYELAKKLIVESGPIQFPDKGILIQKLADLKKSYNWEKKIREELKGFDLPRIASFHVNKIGPALLLYWRLGKQTEQAVRELTCKRMGETLSKANMIKGLAGVRCHFLYPQHPIDQESPLKGVFYKF